MPTNKVIYLVIIVIAASALLWVGAWLAKQVDWILPYTGLFGIVMVIVGMVLEVRRKKASATAGTGNPAAGESQAEG